jgi:hypothetical protein
MTTLQRLRVVWVAIVAFLPLYAGVGVILVNRPGSAAETPRGAVLLVWGALFWVVALAARPVLHRFGVPEYPSYLFAWSAAEAVALAGLVAWVEAGDVRAFAVATALSLALLVVLFPRESAPLEST